MRSLPRWWGDVGAIGALGVATVAYFWRVLLGRALIPWDVLRTLPPWRGPGPVNNPLLADPVRLYAPWRTLLHESLQHGRLPFWDPYVFAGTPFMANSQAALFYPPNLLYGITSVDIATTSLLLVHVWIAAAGMYLLARFGGMRLHIPAALLAAIGFAFAGFAMVWLEFPTFISVYAWMPWSALALWRLVARPSALNFAGLATAVGLAALGGHVQIFQYQLLALGLMLLIACAHQVRSGLVTAARRLALGMTGLAVGLVLAAVQLASTLEAGPLIVRGREPLQGLVAGAFPFRLLPLVALPRAYGSSQFGTWFAPGNQNEYVAFCGVICLLLAPPALLRWRNGLVQALVAVEALAWGIALGSPLFDVLYVVVPTVNQVRGIGRATALHSFALPLLAAIGLEALVELILDPRTRRWGATYLSIATLAVVGLLLVDRSVAHGQLPQPYMLRQYLSLLVPAGAAILLLASGVLWPSRLRLLVAALPLLLLGELYLAYGRYNTADPGPPTLQQPTAVTSFLRQQPGRYVTFAGDEISGNAAIAYRLSTIDGSDSFILRDFADYFNLIEPHEQNLHLNEAGPLKNPDSLRSPLLANLGVTAVVTDRVIDLVGLLGRDPQGSATSQLASGPVFESLPDRVYHVSDVSSLLRPLTCFSQERDEARVIDKMAAVPGALLAVGFTADQIPGEVACTEAQVKAAGDRAASASPAAIGSVDMWGTAQGTTDYLVATPVLYAESRYPGWRVEIDGRPTPLLRIDHALMGVVVPSGHHTVAFSYRPNRLGAGLATSAGAVAVLCAMVANGIRRRVRPAPRGARQPLPDGKGTMVVTNIAVILQNRIIRLNCAEDMREYG